MSRLVLNDLKSMENEKLCSLLSLLDNADEKIGIIEIFGLSGMVEENDTAFRENIRKQIYEVLIENCRHIVNYRVAQYRDSFNNCTFQSEEDFRQEANIAIMEAARTYGSGVEHGKVTCSFEVYASGTAKHHLDKYHKEKCGAVKIPKSSYYDGINSDKKKKDYSGNWRSDSLDRYYDNEDERTIENKIASQGMVNRSAEDIFLMKDEQDVMRKIVAEISKLIDDRQYNILTRHEIYGEKCSSIGKSYGITRQSVRAALLRIKDKLSENEKIRQGSYDAGIIMKML